MALSHLTRSRVETVLSAESTGPQEVLGGMGRMPTLMAWNKGTMGGILTVSWIVWEWPSQSLGLGGDQNVWFSTWGYGLWR